MFGKTVLPLLLVLACFACTDPAPATPLPLVALEDFTLPERPDYTPAYRHKDKNALAIDAAKYKDRFALAETVFAGPDGTYQIQLTTLGETDGESSYRLFVDGKQVAEVQNQPTATDYAPQEHDLGKVTLKAGQTIAVAFNSHSNGKIPEGDGFAFSRGRWTGITLLPR